jgi:hypothetical protein
MQTLGQSPQAANFLARAAYFPVFFRFPNRGREPAVRALPPGLTNPGDTGEERLTVVVRSCGPAETPRKRAL